MIKLGFENKIIASKGKLLLSEPFMKEDYFSRSVILLTEHDNDKGSVGLIINKPADINISELIPEFSDYDAPVYFGGPVNMDNIFYIHTFGNKINEAKHICDRLYWGGDFEQLCNMAKQSEYNSKQIKFFAGYAGWSAGQLNNELEEKSWIVSNLPDKLDVFNNDEKSLWSNILKSMGGEFTTISNFPLNPQDN
jgi:putative transcriptional regulator